VKRRKQHSPDEEMADILYRATLKQYAPWITEEDLRGGLTGSEIRQLWLKRKAREAAQLAKPRKRCQANKGGRPQKVDSEAVKAERKRRIEAGEKASHKDLGRHFGVSPQKRRLCSARTSSMSKLENGGAMKCSPNRSLLASASSKKPTKRSRFA
jgi:hypothetical protein